MVCHYPIRTALPPLRRPGHSEEWRKRDQLFARSGSDCRHRAKPPSGLAAGPATLASRAVRSFVFVAPTPPTGREAANAGNQPLVSLFRTKLFVPVYSSDGAFGHAEKAVTTRTTPKRQRRLRVAQPPYSFRPGPPCGIRASRVRMPVVFSPISTHTSLPNGRNTSTREPNLMKPHSRPRSASNPSWE